MNHKSFSLNVIFIIICCGLSIPIVLAWNAKTSGRTQQEDKVVEKRNDFNPPIKITSVKSRIGDIQTDKKINTSDDDWLKGLKVQVHNQSDKTATFIMVNLWLVRPKNQAQERDFVVRLEYGPNPSFPSQPVDPAESPILPGKTTDVILSDSEYDSLRPLLNERNLPIRRVRVVVGRIDFTDGTSWQAGRIFRRDPNDPEKWIPADKPQASRKGDARADPLPFLKEFYTAHGRSMQIDPCGTASSYSYLKCGSNTDCTYLNRTVLPGDPADSKLQNVEEPCNNRTASPQIYCKTVTSTDVTACPTPTPQSCEA